MMRVAALTMRAAGTIEPTGWVEKLFAGVEGGRRLAHAVRVDLDHLEIEAAATYAYVTIYGEKCRLPAGQLRRVCDRRSELHRPSNE